MQPSDGDKPSQESPDLEEHVYRWLRQNDFDDVASLFAQEVSLPSEVPLRPYLEGTNEPRSVLERVIMGFPDPATPVLTPATMLSFESVTSTATFLAGQRVVSQGHLNALAGVSLTGSDDVLNMPSVVGHLRLSNVSNGVPDFIDQLEAAAVSAGAAAQSETAAAAAAAEAAVEAALQTLHWSRSSLAALRVDKEVMFAATVRHALETRHKALFNIVTERGSLTWSWPEVSQCRPWSAVQFDEAEPAPVMVARWEPTNKMALLRTTQATIHNCHTGLQVSSVEMEKHDLTCMAWMPTGRSLLVCGTHVKARDGKCVTWHCHSDDELASTSVTTLFESLGGYFVSLAAVSSSAENDRALVACVHNENRVYVAQWTCTNVGESFSLLRVLRMPLSMSMGTPACEWIPRTGYRLAINRGGMLGIWDCTHEAPLDPDRVYPLGGTTKRVTHNIVAPYAFSINGNELSALNLDTGVVSTVQAACRLAALHILDSAVGRTFILVQHDLERATVAVDALELYVMVDGKGAVK